MPSDIQRQAASARQRLWRVRQSKGWRIFRAALDEDRVALAVKRAGLLDEAQLQDHGLVERALETLIKRTIL